VRVHPAHALALSSGAAHQVSSQQRPVALPAGAAPC
jgi:hypothetical protein